MVVKLKTTIPLTINIYEVMNILKIENGDSDISIREKIYDFMYSSTMIDLLEDGSKHNLEEVVDKITEEVKRNLRYYTITDLGGSYEII